MLIGLALLGTSFVSLLLLVSTSEHGMIHSMDTVCVAHCIVDTQETTPTSLVSTTAFLGILSVGFTRLVRHHSGNSHAFAFLRGQPPDPRMLLTIIKRD